ncbi:DUF427 domain-containing protein [Mucilaginibacter sabulilitoris]|uniref:DUF427 domain-containing protein n=1 Tax=Mucilaginibacter sabulilitoris TaxID=1173583 RepID=A0ABZ0TVL7_9SPHI|nr:DUF427 domain-containing protein [Mucilaginibacter sabulilitoris]WPU96969.1 DUF427 domain-containing protein [Mucilaginibacter sabulilitoris]
MKAIWNNKIIAQSDNTVALEGNQYFPPESIVKEYFSTTDSHTTCPLKGVASYYDINVDGNENMAAAWYYPNPKSGYQQIGNYVAFWKGVKVEKD